MKDISNITLAIESAIAGGSLSLLRGRTLLDSWAGEADVSKAEDLLPNIDEMLNRSGVSKADLGMIAVSAGPGSFTGIRIGISTALGLHFGLGVAMSSHSALVAAAASVDGNGEITIVVPVGRGSACWQRFNGFGGTIQAVGEPQTIGLERLPSTIAEFAGARSFVHPRLLDSVTFETPVLPLNPNIAFLVGLRSIEAPESVTRPLFIGKTT